MCKAALITVLPNRLISRLRQQNWPQNLINWVQSSVMGRSASIRLDGITGPAFSLTGSLPQGSPVSPILFMLYLQPLFTLPTGPNILRHRGYADDGRITARSDRLEKNCRALEQEFQKVRQWCKNDSIPLDPKKIELMHFSRKQDNSNPGLQMLPTTDETTNSQPDTLLPVPLGESLQWLGVHFDRKLTFRRPVTIMAQKGKMPHKHCRCWGEQLKALRHLYSGTPPKHVYCLS